MNMTIYISYKIWEFIFTDKHGLFCDVMGIPQLHMTTVQKGVGVGVGG